MLYLGNLLAAGIGFAASLIVARRLGPSSYALIVAYNSIIVTLVGITDLGLGVGLIRYTAPLLGSDPDKAKPYFKVVFWAEVISGLIVLILGLATQHRIAGLTNTAAHVDVIRLAIISAALSSGGAFVGISLLAHKRMLMNSILVTTMSVLRLLSILLLAKLGALSTANILLCYVSVTIFNFFIGFLIIPRNYWGKLSKAEVGRVSKSLFKLSGWLTLSSILVAISSRLDFFYLIKIRGGTEAGVYAAALQLSMAFTLLVNSLSSGLTPYVSERTTHESRIKFLKKALAATSMGAVVVAGIIIFAPPIINLLFGPKYIGATPAFRVLGLHFMANLILVPISLLFIPLDKVKYGTLVSAVQLIGALILYPILIHRFGATGAALTVLGTTLFGLLFYSSTLILLLKQSSRSAALERSRPIS